MHESVGRPQVYADVEREESQYPVEGIECQNMLLQKSQALFIASAGCVLRSKEFSQKLPNKARNFTLFESNRWNSHPLSLNVELYHAR
jgi:hypothetical protein